MQNLKLIWSKVQIPIIAIISTFMIGILGYKLIYPAASWNDIIFMTGITLSTVGYGDILGVQKSPLATWYTLFLLIIGMGIVLYSVSAFSAFLIEGQLNSLLLINAIKRKVNKMKNHHIICGAGVTGIHVIREMHARNKDFVVIDTDAEKFKHLRDELSGCNIIIGDPTSDTVLNEANIKNAQTLITTLTDKDNLFLTLTARMLNPDINIISTATELNIDEKLKRAGANYVVNPNFIGGFRIASQVLRPQVVNFMDRMLKNKSDQIRIEEVVIPAGSKANGKSITELKIYEKTGLKIIACAKDEITDEYIYNPPDSTILQSGGILVFIGTTKQQQNLEELIKSLH